MKFIPLNNQPNVSRSRLESISPSLKIDSRGFPCISYLDKKDGFNDVKYSFWDGLQWGFNGDTPSVYRSKESIVCFCNSLVLSEDQTPNIAFARRSALGSKLSVATYSDKWNLNTINVDYSAEWIGIVRWDGIFDYSSSSTEVKSSSSSSSSFSSISSVSISSDSSESSNKISSDSSSIDSESSISSLSSSSSYSLSSISSISSSSISSISSSSILSSSSSSSIDSSSSTSSESIGNANTFVAVYDSTNSRFNIYAVENSWILISSIAVIIDSDNYSKIRLDICGRRIGLAYSDGDIIWYNFFDLYRDSWMSSVFLSVSNSISSGTIVDMDMAGYNEEDIGVMAFGWLEKDLNTFIVKSVLVNSFGIETPSDGISAIIESNTVNVYSSQDYIVNGYRKITICMDGDLPRIVAVGSESRFFSLFRSLSGKSWRIYPSLFDGISNGVVVNYVRSSFSDECNVVISADSGDVYFFKHTSQLPFTMSTPSMVLLNNKWVNLADYSEDEIIGSNIQSSYDSITGCILNDAKNSVAVVSNLYLIPPTTTTTTSTSPSTTTTTSTSLSPTTTTTTTVSPSFLYTWTEQVGSGVRQWLDVDCSDDGSKIVAGVSLDYVYISSDYGVTWSQKNTVGVGDWRVASSSDGSKLVIVDKSQPTYPTRAKIYRSQDSGSSWLSIEITNDVYGDIGDICCSDDGVRIYVNDSSALNSFAVSASSSSGGWFWRREVTAVSDSDAGDIICSSNGSKIITKEVDISDCQVYTNSNYGIGTWAERCPGIPVISLKEGRICCSGDGNKIYMTVANSSNYIHSSVDFGVTWSTLLSAGLNFWGITCSSDGSVIAALKYVGPSGSDSSLYISRDYGVTWYQQITLPYVPWDSALTCSSDGNRITLAAYGYNIYTGIKV